MGRQVRCKDTGIKVNIADAYKVTRHVECKGETISKNEYWSCREAYETWNAEKEARKKCINFMFGLFNYDPSVDKLNSSFYSMLNDYEKIGFDILYETMIGERNSLEWTLEHKEFDTDYQQMRYLMAIINNNVMKYKNKAKKIEKYSHGADIPVGMDESFFFTE